MTFTAQRDADGSSSWPDAMSMDQIYVYVAFASAIGKVIFSFAGEKRMLLRTLLCVNVLTFSCYMAMIFPVSPAILDPS